MAKFWMYFSLGSELIGLVPTLITQFKSPSTLNADGVWAEVSPVLQLLGAATGVNINLVLAQKIVDSAVNDIKTFVSAPAGK